MAKRVLLKQAAEITGLSQWELRQGSLSGKYPYMRIGGKNGRMLFDVELLNKRIDELMLSNVQDNEHNLQGKIRRVL